MSNPPEPFPPVTDDLLRIIDRMEADIRTIEARYAELKKENTELRAKLAALITEPETSDTTP